MSQIYRVYRTGIISLCMGIIYVYLMYLVLGGSYLIIDMRSGGVAVTWILCCSILLGCGHFLAIEIQHISFRIIYRSILALCFLRCAGAYIAGVETRTLLLIVLFHIGCILFFSSKYQMFRDYKYISSWTLVNYGLHNTGMIMTIVLCGIISFTWKSLEVNCDKLYSGWESIESLLPESLIANVDEKTFSSVTLGDMFDIQEQDVKALITDLEILDTVKENVETSNISDRFISSLGKRKDKLIQEISTDKSVINEGFCSLIIDQITKKKDAPLFMYSTTILLFFLLYPLVKILMLVVSMSMYIVLRLAEWGGIYVREETDGTIERIT